MKKLFYVGLIAAIVIIIGAIIALELNAPVLGVCLFGAAIAIIMELVAMVDALCDEYYYED